MKRKRKGTVPAERFRIPTEAGLSERLIITGHERILCENIREIQELGTEQMILHGSKGSIVIYGAELCVKALRSDAIEMEGTIARIEWI